MLNGGNGEEKTFFPHEVILFQYIITSFHAVITIERAISAKMSLLVRPTCKMACVYPTKTPNYGYIAAKKFSRTKRRNLGIRFEIKMFGNSSSQITFKETNSLKLFFQINLFSKNETNFCWAFNISLGCLMHMH